MNTPPKRAIAPARSIALSVPVTVSGVQGMVDCDWFAGSQASLRAL